MIVELQRYRVKPGKSERVDEWMKMLNDRLAECLATFEREKMYVETIFREKTEEGDFLYWFSVRGEGGEPVETSDHDLDVDHLKFWYECIDRSYGRGPVNEQGQSPSGRDLDLQVLMMPEETIRSMQQGKTGEDVIGP